MKYVILLGVVLAGLWWIRQSRSASHTGRPSAPQPTAMVACLHCGVLSPEPDTCSGKLGRYCSPEHRQQHEG